MPPDGGPEVLERLLRPLIVLALRQFSTERPSAITPMAKIATPSRTSYRANAALDLVRNRACVTCITGMLECWSAGALKIPLLHFAIPSLLRCRSSRCILGD